MVWTILVFIIIFGVVVLSHELGHFLIAKLHGIKVLEFAMGMGPRLLHFKRGETEYALRLFPIGGACVFEGEDGKFSDKQETDEISAEGVLRSKSGAFPDAPVWARIATVIAGPIFNLILAYLLAMIVVGFTGETVPTISGVTEGYPAAEVGLQEGDTITHVNGQRVYLLSEITLITNLHPSKELEITYERGQEEYTVVVMPVYVEEYARHMIGFTGTYIEDTGFKVLGYAGLEIRYWIQYTLKSLGMLVTGQLSRDDVSGPVGLVTTIDTVIEESKPYGLSSTVLTLINFATLISVNLGIINLLPLPALDGGRLIFLLVEAVRGKKIAPEKEGIVHFIGFALLMILMVVVLYNDIAKLFR